MTNNFLLPFEFSYLLCRNSPTAEGYLETVFYTENSSLIFDTAFEARWSIQPILPSDYRTIQIPSKTRKHHIGDLRTSLYGSDVLKPSEQEKFSIVDIRTDLANGTFIALDNGKIVRIYMCDIGSGEVAENISLDEPSALFYGTKEMKLPNYHH